MAVQRTYDTQLVQNAIDDLMKRTNFSVSAEEWLADKRCVALLNSEGDLALFEPGVKDIYAGHYYFKSRGRAAIRAAHEFLAYVFETFEWPQIIGLTPLHNLGARWLSKRIGFKSQGVMWFLGNPYEMFHLNRQDYKQ